MTQCNLCSNIAHIPIKLTCSHITCFLCLKYTLLETNQNVVCSTCPICYISNDINLDSLTNTYTHNDDCPNYVWLYSSNYNDMWWAYQNKPNNKLEKIHKDYLIRQEIANAQTSQENSIKINISKTKQKNKIVNYDVPITFDNITIDDDTDDCVDFDDIDNISDENKHVTNHIDFFELSYVIKCGMYEYKIDFDSMKQINVVDVWRKRSIKRLEVPIDIIKTNMGSIVNYLKSQNVIGIAGHKF